MTTRGYRSLVGTALAGSTLLALWGCNTQATLNTGTQQNVLPANGSASATLNVTTLTTGIQAGDIAVDTARNVYAAVGNHVVKISPSGGASNLDTSASAIQLSNTAGIAVDTRGNVFVADNNNIRIITPNGSVSNFAGSNAQGTADGPAGTAQFNSPDGVAVDAAGNVYVSDGTRVRKISAQGTVTTLAGSTTQGFADGSGVNAQFTQLHGIAVDGSGNVFVADGTRIRMISAAGAVTTLAGNGSAGFADGVGNSATFSAPDGVALDSSGNLYVSDVTRVRRVAPGGAVTTWAGSSSTAGFVDGLALSAQFSSLHGIAVDSSGSVYVGDTGNNRVRKIG
ncbi:MAG: hypothetical protein JO247_03705 [Chloroflexi bacterium]|nr:hypothetical protein [Chloroflexota bacterium]